MSQQPAQLNPQQSITKSNRRCSHSTNTGRRCRLRVMNSASGLCFRHHQLAMPRVSSSNPDSVASDLLANTGDFHDAQSINNFLGNVVRQMAHHRISRQDAIAYGYLSQLLLNSLRPLSVERSEDQAEAFRLQVLEITGPPRDSTSHPPHQPGAADSASRSASGEPS